MWATDVTGTIYFGSADGSTEIDAASVSGDDNQDNTWTVTTAGTTSFSQNFAYAQVGSSSKPATSITFTTTLPASGTIKAFSAKFGGISNTAGTVTLKVGDTTVGSGSLNRTQDVTVSATNTDDIDGTVLTVTVTNIAKAVKCYYISYTYEVVNTTSSISADDVEIDYDATGGSIAYTLNNATGNVEASVTSGDWLTLDNENITASAVPFTCSANTGNTARIAQVTLSFTGAENKVVTITQEGAGNQPVGSVEITGGPYSVYVKGWAYDPDDESAAVHMNIKFYRDADCTDQCTIDSWTANKVRTDVAELQGIAGNHGFDEGIIIINGGTYWVKVFATDVGSNNDVQIGATTKIVVKELIVGGIKVTCFDINDILYFYEDGLSDQPLIWFDNDTNTLYFREISKDYYVPGPLESSNLGVPDGTFIYANFDLTIKGNFHMTPEHIECWKQYWNVNTAINQDIYCTGTLTFDGDFTFLADGNLRAIFAKDIILRSGRLAVGGYSSYAIWANDINMESGFIRLETKSTTYGALMASNLTMADNLSIITPDDGYFINNVGIFDSNDNPATHVIIATEAGAAEPYADLETNYPVWVGNKQVTYVNRDDILNDGGKAKYDNATHTLTLNEPTISSAYNSSKIYAEKWELTVEGSYNMTDADTDKGIYMYDKPLTLDGDFTFLGTEYGIDANSDVTVKEGTVSAQGNSCGISGYRNFTVESGTVTATGNSMGISCNGDITVKGGTVTATGNTNYGLNCDNLIVQEDADIVDMTGVWGKSVLNANSLTLSDNQFITTPADGIFKSPNIYYSNGKTWANHAIISPRTASVTFAKEGYGTYYDGTYDVKIPTGMKARIVTEKSGTDGGMLTYETVADGDKTDIATATVPAGTAVLLQTAASEAVQSIDIALYRAIDTRDFTASNLLHGSDAAATTTGEGKYYKLSYGEAGSANADILGWYWGAADGAAFTSGAHKAWLVVPASAAARGYLALPGDDNGIVTGIEDNNRETITNNHWYSLDGRRLAGKPSAKGIYIHNGNKVVIK